MSEVSTQAIQDHRRHLYLPHERVATPAQQSTNAPAVVMVVNDQPSLGRVTQKALAALQVTHLLDFLRREVVLPFESRSQVLLSRSFGVAAAPLAQPLVAAFLVGLPVLGVAATGACAALAPTHAPLGKRVIGQIAGAFTTLGHAPSMPRETITRSLDQPCHADVLLELANGATS